MGSNQSSEETEEPDGGIVADQLDYLHQHIGDFLEQLGNLCFRPAAHLHAEAEEDSGYDQLKNGAAAPELGKVGFGKEAHDQFACVHGCCRRLFKYRLTGVDCDETDQHIHDNGSNNGCAHKGDNSSTHQLARPLRTLHIGNRRGDREEYHRNNHTEHHVDEQCAQRLQCTRTVPGKANDNTEDNTDDHGKEKPVVFEE